MNYSIKPREMTNRLRNLTTNTLSGIRQSLTIFILLSLFSFNAKGNGNENNVEFIFPTITCPADVVVNNDPGTCSANVTIGVPTVTDAGGNTPTNDFNGTGNASGTYPVGLTTVIWSITDLNGDVSTCPMTVLVLDTEAPTMSAIADQTIALDASCTYTTPDFTGMTTIADNCDLNPTVTQYPAAGTILSTSSVVTITAVDDYGNITSISFNLDIIPDPSCTSTSGCSYTLADYTGLVVDSDNCDNNLTLTQSPPSGTEIFTPTTIVVYAVDDAGNVTSCNFTVTPEDNEDPTITCPGDFNEIVDGACNFIVPDYTGLVTATDNCDPILDLTQTPTVGTVLNGSGTTQTVTITATDDNGNSSSCSFVITLEDDEPPVATCPPDVAVDTDPDECFASGVDLGNVVLSDNCGIASLTNDAPANFPVGTTVVTWTVTDFQGLTATCTQNVVVTDAQIPDITCPGDVAVGTNTDCTATGVALGTPTTDDNCGVASVSNDAPAIFPVGVTVVTWTVTDDNGNTNTCTQNVTVTDDVDPVAICQDVTVQLDASGAASITTGDIDNGSSDNCAIDNMSLDITSFDCSNVGANTVTLTVEDTSGNTSTCTATVTVEDNIAPVALCQDVTVQLDASGAGSITTGDIDNGSNDACGIASLALDNTSFDCSNVGANTVTLTVTDVNGNVSTCTATVTVEDNIAPTALCQNVTVQLDGSGAASITTGDIDNGSNDNCGIASLALDNTTFDCSNVGANTVTLTVTDVNGNSSTCTATVTVEDTVNPVAICQDITVQLDATGSVSITTTDIDNGSNDNCGVASLALDITSFDCTNVGPNTVTLTVTDVNGNSSTCTSTVTVEDNVDPIAVCQDITVQLDALGAATITASDIDNGSSDACGSISLSLDITSFDCSNVGPNTVTLTATDSEGNTATCTATVTVEDNVAPVAQCQNVTVQLDALGNASITTGDIDNGSNDACGIASLALDNTSFDCSNVGANTVTLTVTDVNGNSSTCTATVTVEDNVDPVAICQDITVQLDALGNASIVPTDIDNGSNDACGIASLALDITSFDCSNVGPNTVVLTVTDNNGNSSTCSAQVTVEDNVAPQALCQDITVQLDALRKSLLLQLKLILTMDLTTLVVSHHLLLIILHLIVLM